MLFHSFEDFVGFDDVGVGFYVVVGFVYFLVALYKHVALDFYDL